MAKFANCVRFVVKLGRAGEYLKSFKTIEPFDGLESHHVAQTGDQTFVSFGVWESEEAIAAARPAMIAFLDTSVTCYRKFHQSLA